MKFVLILHFVFLLVVSIGNGFSSLGNSDRFNNDGNNNDGDNNRLLIMLMIIIILILNLRNFFFFNDYHRSIPTLTIIVIYGAES